MLLDWLALVEHELLLFAAFWFVIGAVDELAIDVTWIWLRFKGKVREQFLPRGYETRELDTDAAIFVPTWRESQVIGQTVRHALSSWQQRGLRLYVGCYRNDPDTVAAAIAAAGEDARIRVVIHDRDGPTTKADCLNRLYEAMRTDEARRQLPFGSVVLHDAEDMVHPASLALIDEALGDFDFVQLPVRPEPQAASTWIAGHYADEFTEAHAKTMVVRDALGAAIPAAGVGCGFTRSAIARLASARADAGESGPFSADCLTEDYELGLLMSGDNGRGTFLRMRDADGALVATRSYFPITLDEAVRQKTRWLHGIAFQGWDRLGWSGRAVDSWMRLRDRRGPLTALVLAVAYSLIVIEAAFAVARLAGLQKPLVLSPVLEVMLTITLASFVWRAGWRMFFTTREYGIAEGVRSVPRTMLANIIAIMSGRRALAAYVRTLFGGEVIWEKTRHSAHPAAHPTPHPTGHGAAAPVRLAVP